MAVIKSGISSTTLTIDPTSKAARITLYDSTGAEMSPGIKTTFSAANTFTPVAGTDYITVTGSATKIIRVYSMVIATTNTTADSMEWFLIKRASIDTGGTFIQTAGVPHDSNDTATAVVGHYTAAPTITGAFVGRFNTSRVPVPVTIPTSWAQIARDAGMEMIPKILGIRKSIVLRGVNELLILNLNSGHLPGTGQSHAYRVLWTEE